jgi:ceramide glucosyltransferase
MIAPLFCFLTALSWIYWIIAGVLTWRFFHGRQQQPDFAPPVSILKPVKGVDAGAYENFASFCRQDYPEFELIFSVADADDDVIPLIRQLRDDFPAVRIRLVMATARGTNRKASMLHVLAREAAHDILVVNDSDMRVSPDYLRRVVAPLGDPKTGIVTCPYRGEDPVTLTARLEALHMGVTFLPSAIIAWQLMDLKFALGATMVLRRADLNRMGGFAAVADHLADDYEIGSRIGALGLNVCLSTYVVSSMLGATSFRDQWDREIRWSRCNRVSQPAGYAGMVITYSTPMAVAFLALDHFAPLGWLMVAGSMLVRWLVARLIAGQTGDTAARRFLVLLPVRDMLSFVVWIAGGFGRQVVWRGETFEVLNDGRLQEPARPTAAAFAWVRVAARRLGRRPAVGVKTEVPR